MKAYEILKTADLPELQARAMLTAIGSIIADHNLHQAKDLAAREDRAKLDAKGSIMETTLKQDMFKLEANLRLDLSKLERMMVETKSGLETKIAEAKSELLRRMFVFWVGQVATTIAVIFPALRLPR